MVCSDSNTPDVHTEVAETAGWAHFLCPECMNGTLNKVEGAACCGSCASVFKIADGAIDFSSGTSGASSTKEDYESTLARLLEDTKADGWMKALESNLPKNSAEYATDTRKSDFLALLDFDGKVRALDLGCGLGPITVAMANEFEFVDALDAVLEQAQFVSLRAAQCDLTNVTCCSAPPGGVLPYQDGTFDLVVMSGVIEWVATARGMDSISPIACQEKILREVYRVLRPGGLLYLTTKNRFALRYIMGQQDEHTGLPFTSLVPATIANWIQRVRTGREYRTRLLSKRSLRSLLAVVGFADLRFWALLPSFRSPSCYVNLEDRQALRDTRSRRLGFERLMRRERALFTVLPSQAISIFAYCFAVVARKNS